MSALERELAIAIDAATRAASAVMEVYAGAFAVDYKAVDDPVTAADRAANVIIEATLRSAFPDDALVSEESPIPTDFATRHRCWFVDPLDGTRELVARNGEFCVMIGLAIEGRATLGVVAVPATGDVLGGVVGEGTVRVDGGSATQVHLSKQARASDARILVSRSRVSPRLDAIFTLLGATKRVPCGSVGVKVSRMLLGAADAYVHPRSDSGPHHWDLCAPEALVVAAGGAFTDERGNAFDYRTSDLVHRHGLVASNGPLHSALLDAVARTSG